MIAVQNLLKELHDSRIRLVAVSKTKPVEQVMEIYNQGQRVFGENIVQELAAKYEQLPKDIEWHLIGHLQTNKVKYVTPFVAMIESVDSFKVLKEIDKQAGKNGRVIDCLLEIRIAEEESKYGFTYEEVEAMLQSPEFKALKNIRICGVMGIGTFTEDETQTHLEFRGLKQFFDQLKSAYFADKDYFREISMGMSGDYEIAIEEGSTMVRIGSLIFGERG
ncbi:MAG: YggS family pyridoxal phosphate-dependent enzyme [Phaeodactylibacter sp.]|nr:YggS family pyridoxal phosphate-dependent enzyme [Phaeodactylibacter sp.]MCB9275857.1 YggS family pyridoxal phosphate-dependent enzyme [Lewinellaceae bacterium]